jgi:hypothetical protein
VFSLILLGVIAIAGQCQLQPARELASLVSLEPLLQFGLINDHRVGNGRLAGDVPCASFFTPPRSSCICWTPDGRTLAATISIFPGLWIARSQLARRETE